MTFIMILITYMKERELKPAQLWGLLVMFDFILLTGLIEYLR